jgi:hypothetical protein
MTIRELLIVIAGIAALGAASARASSTPKKT